MGFFNWFSGNIEKRSINHQNHEEETNTIGSSLSFGAIFQNNISRNLSVIHRCTDLISDSVAMLPILIRNKKSKHSEDIEGHNLHFVFDNLLLGKYMFMKRMIEDVILNGNSYAYIKRGMDGNVIDLIYLQKGEVTVNYNKERGILNYKISNRIGIKGIVQKEDMIHLVRYSDDGIQGKSVLSYASRSINLAHSAENSATNFFKNGGNLSGLLKVNGTLSSKQRTDILNSWNQTYSNGGQGLCVIPGNMDYQAISSNPSESQLLETREYNVVDLCRFFGISPCLIGDLTHSQYGTLEVAQQEFITHTLQPYILMVEQEFTRKLLKDNDLVVNLDENYLLRTDKSTLATYYSTMVKNGILCINECREDMGLSPIEGGDQHIIPWTDLNKNVIGGTEESQSNEEEKNTDK
ncbi:MAG: phage portal protein [Muribaculaceae bacterium]|nr:phage portal protein [Muribaculaceae bacterium]